MFVDRCCEFENWIPDLRIQRSVTLMGLLSRSWLWHSQNASDGRTRGDPNRWPWWINGWCLGLTDIYSIYMHRYHICIYIYIYMYTHYIYKPRMWGIHTLCMCRTDADFLCNIHSIPQCSIVLELFTNIFPNTFQNTWPSAKIFLLSERLNSNFCLVGFARPGGLHFIPQKVRANPGLIFFG